MKRGRFCLLADNDGLRATFGAVYPLIACIEIPLARRHSLHMSITESHITGVQVTWGWASPVSIRARHVTVLGRVLYCRTC